MPNERLALLSAEQVPAETAQQALARYNTRRKPAGVLHSAWNHLEYAMNNSNGLDDDTRMVYFNFTQELIGDILTDAESPQTVQLAALRLSSFIPLFRKRKLREEITADDCRDLYRSLASVIMFMRPLSIDEPPQTGIVEMACEALTARSLQPEYILYPTSPREEASPHSSYNHDSYFIVDDQKVPLQQKQILSHKTYQLPIQVYTLCPILDKALKKYNMISSKSAAQNINALLSLIVADSEGEALTRAELGVLNHMTQSVIAYKQPPNELAA